MNMTKEMLLGMGISEKDADVILAQANSEETKSEEKEKVVQVTCVPNAETTTISQLSEYSKGQVVQLPDFAPGQSFVARLRRPSLLVLMKNGKIPNSLLGEASSLFDKNKKNDSEVDPSKMSNMLSIMETLAEAALVSPTYEEIKSAGVALTDEQLMAIFNYTQGGIEDLKSFR